MRWLTTIMQLGEREGGEGEGEGERERGGGETCRHSGNETVHRRGGKPSQ